MKKLDLRADLESRIYPTKKKSKAPKQFLFWLVAICFIFIVLLTFNTDKVALMLAGAGSPYEPSLKETAQVNNESTISDISDSLQLRPVGSDKPVAAPAEDVNLSGFAQREDVRLEVAPVQKQRVFNDENYQPQGSVNSIAPPPHRYYDKGQAQTKAQLREINRTFHGVRTKRTVPWQWKSERTNRSGRFSYTQTDRGIETHNICSNYKYGSFEYRDCRKAAKKYFQDVCSSQFKAACMAAEMIP